MDTGLQTRINESISRAYKGNLNADALMRLVNDCLDYSPDRKIMHHLLDLAHIQSVAKIISKAKVTEETVFNMIRGDDLHTLSYSELWSKIQMTAKALSVLDRPEQPSVIGLLTYNQLNGVLVDLACLSFGTRIIPIPLHSTPEHISFILKQSEVTHIFVGGKTAIRLWNDIHHKHNILVIALNDSSLIQGKVMEWEMFYENRERSQNFDVDQRLSSVPMDRTQTIMYTSGSTANPKGITFNQNNIISKRFARALALPDFSSDDIFLCYLPLFHTFGRYFELMGSIFWGATYSFAESPAFNSLLKDFLIVNPSIFISIPKRWVQLYEMLEKQIDMDFESQQWLFVCTPISLFYFYKQIWQK